MLLNNDEEYEEPTNLQREKGKRQIELTLLHRRFGHRSIKALLAADASKVWNGIRVSIDPTGICNTCQVTFARMKSRGNK